MNFVDIQLNNRYLLRIFIISIFIELLNVNHLKIFMICAFWPHGDFVVFVNCIFYKEEPISNVTILRSPRAWSSRLSSRPSWNSFFPLKSKYFYSIFLLLHFKYRYFYHFFLALIEFHANAEMHFTLWRHFFHWKIPVKSLICWKIISNFTGM